MAITAFDLDLTSLDRFTMLVYGAYGCGKTHLLGDFLRWASAQGPIAFINIKGQEDGELSLVGMGLGAVGIHIDTPGDLEGALEMLQPKGLVALAVDTLSAYESAVRVDVIGSDRLPDAKIDGERAKALWGQIKIKTRAGVVASRHAARYVVWSAPFDRSEDPFGGPGRFLSPDLIGKSSRAAIGWFDLAALMEAKLVGPGRVQRTLSLAPRGDAYTRVRLPKPLLKEIDIPEGGGGWAKLYEAIQATMPVPPKEMK